MKIYKLYDSAGYTCGMKVYLQNAKQHKVQDVRATHAELNRKVGGLSHKLYRDNFFSSTILFGDLTEKKTGRKGYYVQIFTSNATIVLFC
jgi:hypothetical protein